MELLNATIETIYMTVVSLCLAYIFATPLAFLTVETSSHGLFPCKPVHSICDLVIAIGRSIPFVIMMVLALPFTRWLVGTGVGTTATIVPLTIAAIPFVARMIESSLDKVDYWIVVAARMDKASKFKIMFKIKLMSQLYDIIDGIGITSISIIGYTTMAGVVGGGGLGNYAITHGFYQYDWLTVLWATLIIIAIVCVFQIIFKGLSLLIDWRKK